jgi:hypothetical protein
MVGWSMIWAVVRESWRKGFALLGAVAVALLLLRGLATQPSFGDWASEEAAQVMQLMALLGLMPLLAVALAGSRPLDADVAWVLARPIPRWWLAVIRIATDASILAACLVVALAVLGVPDQIAFVQASGSVVDVTNPWVVLLVAIMAHGCTAAFTAIGSRPLAAVALGAAWITSMAAVPLVTRAIGLAWLSHHYVRGFEVHDPAYDVIFLAQLAVAVIMPLACLGISWRMIVAGARHAPLAAPLRPLVRWSAYIQALCVVIQAAAFAHASSSIPNVLHRGDAGIRARFQDEQGRPIAAWQPVLTMPGTTPAPFVPRRYLDSTAAEPAPGTRWVVTDGEVVDIAPGVYSLCTRAIPQEALAGSSQRLACWAERRLPADECVSIELVEGYSTVVVTLQTPLPWQPDCPWLSPASR